MSKQIAFFHKGQRRAVYSLLLVVAILVSVVSLGNFGNYPVTADVEFEPTKRVNFGRATVDQMDSSFTAENGDKWVDEEDTENGWLQAVGETMIRNDMFKLNYKYIDRQDLKAPATVYSSFYRSYTGLITYTVEDLTPNRMYKIRVHFADCWGGFNFGVNVSANNTTYIEDLLIPAVVTGNGGRDFAYPVAKEFIVAANNYGEISVSVSAANKNEIDGATIMFPNDSVLCGLEVIDTGTTADAPGDLSVAPIPSLKVNCGNDQIAGWENDYTYLDLDSIDSDNFGTGSNNAPIIDPEINAAPEGVYTWIRYGNYDYTVFGLPVGQKYMVRMHYCELYDARTTNLSLNGTPVGQFIPGHSLEVQVVEGTATVNSDGQIIIGVSGINNDVGGINGFELIPITGGETEEPEPLLLDAVRKSLLKMPLSSEEIAIIEEEYGPEADVSIVDLLEIIEGLSA